MNQSSSPTCKTLQNNVLRSGIETRLLQPERLLELLPQRLPHVAVLHVEEEADGQADDERGSEVEAVDVQVVGADVDELRLHRVDLEEDVAVDGEEEGDDSADERVPDDLPPEVVLGVGRSQVDLDPVADELGSDGDLQNEADQDDQVVDVVPLDHQEIFGLSRVLKSTTLGS